MSKEKNVFTKVKETVQDVQEKVTEKFEDLSEKVGNFSLPKFKKVSKDEDGKLQVELEAADKKPMIISATRTNNSGSQKPVTKVTIVDHEENGVEVTEAVVTDKKFKLFKKKQKEEEQ